MPIKNIIFDFGDVFIDLDKTFVFKQMPVDDQEAREHLQLVNEKYEVGAITTVDFLDGIQSIYPQASHEELKNIWNRMLLGYPDYRLEFIENLATTHKYRLFLLSNTNELHIENVAQQMGDSKYRRFKSCFERFYLSHEIGLRKPNTDIFEFVLRQNRLSPDETLFIDDTLEHTLTAKSLGIHTWHLKVDEDVVDLKNHIDTYNNLTQ
ncbi:HAD family hydrolase [Nonlabens ponticola]|uniref:HAD family phosphatase n=1 Tax=Nonlabens ponticola TaxID=2496866 RepID=A0A3S9N0L7_9FLAO|nr:HAD family phosphatase [Nonlabens ponticola]AZQ44924.1 HAD family phosphatase [Nonlabens ponticola]